MMLDTTIDTDLVGWHKCLLCGVTTRHACCDLSAEPALTRLLLGMMLPTLHVGAQVRSRYLPGRRVEMSVKTPWGTELVSRRWDDESYYDAITTLTRAFVTSALEHLTTEPSRATNTALIAP